MVRIKINNIEFLVNSKLSVLEACQFVGIHVPRFCYHETLSIAGNCRMCLVEIEKAPKPVASCALPISNNISIFTDSPLVKKARENVIEALLLNHPLDCPICDQGGECDLQDQTKIFGGDYSRYYNEKRVVESKIYGTFIKTIMTRCIHCTRCVRFSDEIAGTSSFGTFNRGKNTEIGGYIQNIFDSEVSGNVVDLCPVGALTLKPYAFKARPWELKCQETIDFTGSLGTPILVNLKESEIVRIQPKIDSNLDSTLISDKIRFSYDSVKKNRIQKVFQKNELNLFDHNTWFSFFETIKTLIKNKKTITFLVNENIDLYSLNFLKNLEGDYIKIASISTNNSIKQANLFDSSLYNKTNTISKNIKTCFLLSTNLKVETTLLNTKLRLKYNKTSFSTISTGLYYKTNYPVKFINLSSISIIQLFEGKLSNSENLILSPNTLLVFGTSFNKHLGDMNILLRLFKSTCTTGLIIRNEIAPNSVGSNFIGIKNVTQKNLVGTDYFFCVGLEDSINVRKIIKNKKFFWLNTHGSSVALEANYILPTTTFLENEQVVLNIDGIKKTTQKLLPNFKDCLSLKNIISTIFNDKAIQTLNVEFFTNKQTNVFKNINLSINLKTFVNKNPIKSILENHYLDSVYTKNSILLNQRFQEQNKMKHNIF